MDIVDGLRLAGGAPTKNLDCFNCHSRMLAAADEIVRLRAESRYDRELINDLKHANTGLVAELAATQAKLDAVMWEYCPEDMTFEQIIEWGRHQSRVSPEKYQLIEAALRGEGE